MRNRGFTVVELVVALGLIGITSVLVGKIFVSGMRTYGHQTELARVRADLRLATTYFTSELSSLNAADTLGSDIVEMGRTSITYRAFRSVAFLCRPADVAASTVTVWHDSQDGLRQMDPARDSLLVFVENDELAQHDNVWIPVGLLGVAAGSFCPGRRRGLRLSVRGLKHQELEGLRRGAPVRAFQHTMLRLYSDAESRSWVGMRELRPATGWTITQPLFGPVRRNGLRFTYFGSDDGLASVPNEVVLIRADIVGVGGRTYRGSNGSIVDSLSVVVGLRNNPSGR